MSQTWSAATWASARRWCDNATTLNVELPKPLTDRIRGINALDAATRELKATDSGRPTALAALIDAATTGHGPDHAAEIIDKHIADLVQAEHRRGIYAEALAAAQNKAYAWLRGNHEQLITGPIRDRFNDLLNQARHDRANPPKAGDLNALAVVENRLDTLTELYRLRSKLWDITATTLVGGARFWAHLRDNEHHEDRRLITGTGFPSKLPTPAGSRDWWRHVLDHDADVWFPSAADLTARVAEYDRGIDDARRAAAAAGRASEQANIAKQAAWMAELTRPKTPTIVGTPAAEIGD